jgi:hypothetical protein
MADAEVHKARDAVRRFGSSLRGLARRVATGPAHDHDSHAGHAHQGAGASPPFIPLTNIRRSIGRARVGCENEAVCGGTIELALHEHNGSHSDVGETAIIDATMIEQTCSCELSDEEREHVVDRVREAIRLRG